MDHRAHRGGHERGQIEHASSEAADSRTDCLQYGGCERGWQSLLFAGYLSARCPTRSGAARHPSGALIYLQSSPRNAGFLLRPIDVMTQFNTTRRHLLAAVSGTTLFCGFPMVARATFVSTPA